MKLYLSQIDQLFDKINQAAVKALLLYGPDKGYISKICELIVKKFNLVQTSFTYQDIKGQHLDIVLNSQNFFNKKELIKITEVTNSLDADAKVILKGNFFHFAVFIGDEISPSSSIRKFFETENNLASIGCYYDEEQNIVKILLQKARAADKTIAPEALTYLKSHLKGDHKLIISEIDKLLSFANDKDQITIEDAIKVISSELIASGDDLSFYLASKNLEGFLQELEKLKAQEINNVLIIRNLIRFYLNLYIALSKLEAGDNIDNAMKSLTPPIFFKYVNNFKKVVNALTTNDVVKALSILQQAEIDFKLAPQAFDFYQKVYKAINKEI